MTYCIFKDNQNTLVYRNYGTLQISNSFIDDSQVYQNGVNNSITREMTYQMQFFSSHYCTADFPLIMPTLIQTIEKLMTPKETRTHDECRFSYPMVYWRQVSVIFSFTFLNPVMIFLIT